MSEYLLGYLITKRIKRVNKILPNKYISVSDCMADIYPYFTLPKDSKRSYLKKYSAFNISDNSIREIDNWIHEELIFENYFQNGYFHNLEQAKKFKERFLIDENDVELVGIYLDSSDYDYFMNDDHYFNQTKEYFPISKKTKYNQQGTVLGYEVFGSENGWVNGHDTKCNDLTGTIEDKFGFIVNENGLYNSFKETREIVSWLNSDGLAAEPVPYISIMIVKYG